MLMTNRYPHSYTKHDLLQNPLTHSTSYEYETFKIFQLYLSEYAADPQGTAKMLDGLLDDAMSRPLYF